MHPSKASFAASLVLFSTVAASCVAPVPNTGQPRDADQPDVRGAHDVPTEPLIGVWRWCYDSAPDCSQVGRGIELAADGTWLMVASAWADDPADARFCVRDEAPRGEWRRLGDAVVMTFRGRNSEWLWRVVSPDRTTLRQSGRCSRMRKVSASLNIGVCNEADAPCAEHAECASTQCSSGHCVHEGTMEPPGLLEPPLDPSVCDSAQD